MTWRLKWCPTTARLTDKLWIWSGFFNAGNINGDRSAAAWPAMTTMVSAGLTDAEIEATINRYPNGVGERYIGKAGSLKAEIRRARKKTLPEADVVIDAGHGPRWANVTRNGAPTQSYENTRIAMLALGIRCEYDLYHNRLTLQGRSIEGFGGKLTDYVCAMVRQKIVDEFGFDPTKAHVRDVTETLCLQNSFDPVVDYFAGLKWDQLPRLERWLSTYLGAPDNELNRAVGAIVLTAAVRRARRPGCKFDTIPVLEGPQGSGKSSALRILAGPDNFSDQDLLTLDAKAQVENLEGVLIYELSELQGLSKAEVNKIKAFASRQEDRARPAYGRFREDRPRRGIFVGTTNDSEYLKDPTGNRRFLPVVTTEIDLKALERDRDQLWAEAADLEASGYSIVLPQELWQAAGEEQARRMETDPWETTLKDLDDPKPLLFDGDRAERMGARNLLTDFLKIPAADQTPYHYRRLGICMRRLGWVGPENIRIDGSVVKGYERKRKVFE